MDRTVKTMWRVGCMLVAAIALAGCVPSLVRVDNTNAEVTTDQTVKMKLPLGWVRFVIPSEPGLVVITRDGRNVQSITFTCRAADNAFPIIKKGMPSSALPTDLADLHLANMKASPRGATATATSVTPASVGNARAFRMIVENRTEKGLTLRTAVLGFEHKNQYCSASFTAPAIHYWNRDLPEFDAFAKSIAL
jgi:hypothetical protein